MRTPRTWLQRRTDAEMRALMGGKAAVFAVAIHGSRLYRELDGSGADEDVASLMSPLNRTVNVWRPDLLTLPEDDFLPWLAAELRCRCGFNQTVWSADILAAVGVNRICPLGEMDRANPAAS
ncbi:MAG: acyl-CoA reductase [Bifidobacterium breve]